MKKITGAFLQQKNTRDTISGRHLSKTKRMDGMYKIVTDRVYGKKYTKSERIMACSLVQTILKEEE